MMPPLHERPILVTGATGLVGAEVTARLARHRRLIATIHRAPRIVRNDGTEIPTGEYGSAATEAVSTLVADVGRPGFGLDTDTLDDLGREVGAIVHCAATIALDAAERDYSTLNVAATGHAVELASRWKVPLVHVSTAYVCGRRGGHIREEELDLGQDFSNGYERSKLRAEQLVRSAPGLRWTIVRPAIVTGSATDGMVRDYKNLYTLLKLIVEGKLRRLPGRYDATLSLVPVDYTADAIVKVALMAQSDATGVDGRTFHIAGSETLSLREISDIFAEYPSFEVATFVSAASFSTEDLDPLERDYYDRLGRQYTCYFDRVRTFDDTGARTALEMQPPATGKDYLRTLLDYCLASGYLGLPQLSIAEVLDVARSSAPGPGIAVR